MWGQAGLGSDTEILGWTENKEFTGSLSGFSMEARGKKGQDCWLWGTKEGGLKGQGSTFNLVAKRQISTRTNYISVRWYIFHTFPCKPLKGKSSRNDLQICSCSLYINLPYASSVLLKVKRDSRRWTTLASNIYFHLRPCFLQEKILLGCPAAFLQTQKSGAGALLLSPGLDQCGEAWRGLRQ